MLAFSCFSIYPPSVHGYVVCRMFLFCLVGLCQSLVLVCWNCFLSTECQTNAYFLILPKYKYFSSFVVGLFIVIMICLENDIH
ncbi:hypothetical protein XENTR_v10007929 [Xenopus tropicalis]|nr:hypothetical protein XENTR_v10007929 [Xenopus tropicalis]